MTRNVLPLGRLGIIVETQKQHLRTPDVRLFVATGLEEVRSAFARLMSITSSCVRTSTGRPVLT